MNKPPDWLPPPLRYSDFNGDWDQFLAAVYKIFERDFKLSRPDYGGYPVAYDSKLEDGKEAAYWHVVSRDDPTTKDRELNLRRCERVAWVNPIIEHSTDKAVSMWKIEQKRPNRGRQVRVKLWLEDQDYIVILTERPRGAVLVTAFCTDFESERRKLRKERDDYLKTKQKPPSQAT
ncbi:MAG: hypothetical protein NTZ04_02075 [Chloroflexi bacterium]|nr:hypothetical protein [Chloroflexota bacterium]